MGKSIKVNKEKMKAQLDELRGDAQSIAAEELKDTAPLEYSEINPEKVKETIAMINAAIDEKDEADKKVKQKLNYALNYAKKH